MKIGINLAGVVYWTTEFPFINAIHQSSFQGSSGLFYREVNKYPAGPHLVLFDGKGKLEFNFNLRQTVTVSGTVINIVPSYTGGVQITVAYSDPIDPIRNIKVIPQEFEHTVNDLFRPDFLERWRGYHAIRFMDWSNTNASDLVNWSDRPIPNDYGITKHGTPYEYVIGLANKLDTDPWLCVPHKATDDYVANLAHLVKSTLNPSLTPYFEYSNETWNWGFPQSTWVYTNFKDNNEYGRTLNWVECSAYRSTQVMKIIKNVWIARLCASPFESSCVAGYREMAVETRRCS